MINQLSQHGILMLIPDRSPQSLLNLKSMCEELVNFSFCWIIMFCELWVQVKIFVLTPTLELQMKKTDLISSKSARCRVFLQLQCYSQEDEDKPHHQEAQIVRFQDEHEANPFPTLLRLVGDDSDDVDVSYTFE